MKILVDSDALLALINTDDSLHAKAKDLLLKLDALHAQLILLPTTLSEFSLIAVNKVGLNQTRAMVDIWTAGETHQVIEIDQRLVSAAVKLFNSQTSKEESLFDCFIMAATVRYGYDAIFSFDQGYLKTVNKELKLKLASGLFS